MSSTAPLITIGITCFNAEDLIIKAIEGAQMQDWPNYEIIIVDDASSDGSVDLIQDYIKNRDNIHLICHPENKGFPSALNTIIEHAKGDFITLFDDDDVSAPDRLSKQHARLTQHMADKKTHLVMCYTNRKVVYANNEKQGYGFTAIGATKGKEPHGDMVADYILWDGGNPKYAWGMFGSCTLMVHQDLFETIGVFDPLFRRNTEWDMAIRCALQGGHFIAVNEPLITQTKTPTQDKSGKTPLKYSLLLREKYKDYLKNKGLYRAAKLVAHSRFYGGKAQKITSNFYMLLAGLCAPNKILFSKIKRVLAR